jgi:hypothetical protein
MNKNIADRKRNFLAIWSMVLAVLSAVWPFILAAARGPFLFQYGGVFLNLIVPGTILLIGFIFGFLGLRTDNKEPALISIAVCTMALLWRLFFSMVWRAQVYH